MERKGNDSVSSNTLKGSKGDEGGSNLTGRKLTIYFHQLEFNLIK